MMKDQDVAADVNKALHQAFHILGDSMRDVSQRCNEEDAAEYREKISDIFYIIVFKLLEPLYEQHPQLKPADWDQTVVT
jgi:hypothetical protein